MSDKEILEEIKRLKNYKKSEWSIEEIFQVDNAINHLQMMLIENRINRAIEYIEQVNKDKDQVPYLTEGETLKLLDILRGEDNEC